MATPAWMIYVGAIAGTIGAVTGITGAVMGYLSYRRSSQLKSVDVRLELRRQATDVRLLLTDLPPLMQRAKTSHLAVASATGMHSSGATERWLQALEADLLLSRDLRAALPAESKVYTTLTLQELEEQLLQIHSLRSNATRLVEKYKGSLVSDEDSREKLQTLPRFRT